MPNSSHHIDSSNEEASCTLKPFSKFASENNIKLYSPEDLETYAKFPTTKGKPDMGIIFIKDHIGTLYHDGEKIFL
jgi:hypothetical protein